MDCLHVDFRFVLVSLLTFWPAPKCPDLVCPETKISEIIPDSVKESLDFAQQAARACQDLVAHFENFNMEQLGASGGNMHRSLTERQALSPGGRKAGDHDGQARGEEAQR